MWKLWVVCALYGAVLPLNHGSSESKSCKVVSERCFSASEIAENPEVKCKSGSTLEDFGHLPADKNYCQIQPDQSVGEKTWAECDNSQGQCPPGDNSIASFCKTRPVACKFPFYDGNGDLHNNCTNTKLYADDENSSENVNFLWCATETNEDDDMVFWGKCDLESCFPEKKDQSTTEEPPEVEKTPSVAIVEINSNFGKYNIIGTVKFEQSYETDEELPTLKVTGTITGLPEGRHGFHVHEFGNTSDNCMAAGSHFNPYDMVHGGVISEPRHVGDFGNIMAEENGVAKINFEVTNFPDMAGPKSIIDKTLVIHEKEDDLGQNEDDGSKSTGNAGARLACGIITKSLNDDDKDPLIFIIIITLAVIAVILLILIMFLLIYCCKKQQPRVEDTDKDIPNGVSKKQPLYDELSIPFIDASPTPTPKVGRSTERLSFFNRTPSIGRSRGSLSNEEATA